MSLSRSLFPLPPYDLAFSLFPAVELDRQSPRCRGGVFLLRKEQGSPASFPFPREGFFPRSRIGYASFLSQHPQRTSLLAFWLSPQRAGHLFPHTLVVVCSLSPPRRSFLLFHPFSAQDVLGMLAFSEIEVVAVDSVPFFRLFPSLFLRPANGAVGFPPFVSFLSDSETEMLNPLPPCCRVGILAPVLFGDRTSLGSFVVKAAVFPFFPFAFFSSFRPRRVRFSSFSALGVKHHRLLFFSFAFFLFL